MLAKMYLTNFLSFFERTEFDFIASKYNILSDENVADNGILKGALVIGANVSGKSNALCRLKFIINLIKGEGVKLSSYRCYFTKRYTTSAEYKFVFSGKKVLYKISYDTRAKSISEILSIDEREILKLGEAVIIEEQLDNETLVLRTASFNTGRFSQEPILRELMDYLNNSYYIDGYNESAFFGKSIIKYAENKGVEKLKEYLKDFNYDFFRGKSQYYQLYITSHDTNLISNSVFRPDQINLITFENSKGSKVKRISIYKP